MIWFILINIILLDIYVVYIFIKRIFDKTTAEQSKSEILENETINDSETDEQKLERLRLLKKKAKKTIAEKEEIIINRQYKNAQHFNNLKKKIKNLEEYIKKLDLGIDSLVHKTTQEKYCEKIDYFMRKNFPNVKYELKNSESTASIYMSINGVSDKDKCIRFSDHPTNNKIHSYPFKVINSDQQMTNIIKANQKRLGVATVLSILEKESAK